MVDKVKKIYEYTLIKLSKEFDEEYYLQKNPDVKNANMSALKHFCNYGWKEKRNPSKEFDVDFYLSTYSDVERARINPLLHYIKHGKKEGRKINDKGLVVKRYTVFEKVLFLLQDAKEKPYLVGKFIYELKHNGFRRTFAKTKFFLRKNLPVSEVVGDTGVESDVTERIFVVPYYIDPLRGEKAQDIGQNLSLALHIYVDSIEGIKKLTQRLKFLPPFDLYLSVAKEISSDEVKEIVSILTNVKKSVFKSVPSYLGATGSMVTQFSKELLAHEYIGHFHTGLDEYAGLLLEESGRFVGEILTLLQTDIKIVFAQSDEKRVHDPSGWYGNKKRAKTFLEKYTDIKIDDYARIEFPENGMFWAKSASLEKLFKLSLDEQIWRKDTKLNELLNQLLLLFADAFEGKNYCIYCGDTLRDYIYYEAQEDFSQKIVHNDIKVLSYYLGQFHPIPENDAWHGKGFTEWTNVKSAYPLYEGHYQQHIPHEDVGYYMLDHPDILKKQAQMMKKSGVYGQIFYHYWFTGKLILEKPVQMLLEHKEIDMPFCFCWANENWTKRWDGNESEILLGQEYSAEDARAFIRYLIPFFQDSRYIKVDGRPMLYVYRPSSIPDAKVYIDIWKEECEKAFLKAPYVVAVLTRGATHPGDHAMDAGVERILHDWTGGAVPEMKNALKQYHPMSGSVLSYDEVAKFYEEQTAKKDFTYFRSISPMWDNTARYNEGAILLDHPTPYRFQSWFKKLLDYTKKTLPEEERFLVVNAWNEWAEGAHLEPDTYHGYAYLNSIGRAMSGISYGSDVNVDTEIPPKSTIKITMSESLQRELKSDTLLREQFIRMFNSASVCDMKLNLQSDVNLLKEEIESIQDSTEQSFDFTVEIRRAALFDGNLLEKLLQSACAFPYSKIIANAYDKERIYKVAPNGSVDAKELYDAPIIAYKDQSSKNVKLRTDAKVFIISVNSNSTKKIPHITTIMRFHKSGSFEELKYALYSLAAMKDVLVFPLITAQDLDTVSVEKLQKIVDDIPLKRGSKISIKHFNSPGGIGDLRTTMLNEALKSVETKYAAFLDYDDLLFYDAYAYLVARLEQTGKAIAFGRVYETSYDGKSQLIVKREKKYEYGFSYEDFIGHNHAPLHSFMIDVTQFDLSKIIYYEDQKYMEDYLLTLQLFKKENADWEALKENIYIGDYIHHLDRDHTLAFTDEKERSKLLDDPEYQRDDKRISNMRTRVL